MNTCHALLKPDCTKPIVAKVQLSKQPIGMSYTAPPITLCQQVLWCTGAWRRCHMWKRLRSRILWLICWYQIPAERGHQNRGLVHPFWANVCHRTPVVLSFNCRICHYMRGEVQIYPKWPQSIFKGKTPENKWMPKYAIWRQIMELWARCWCNLI